MVQIANFAAFTLNTRNLSHQGEFYNDRWGLQVVDESSGSLYLRAEGPRHHVLSLHESDGEPGLRSIVFELADGYSVTQAHEELLEAGVEIVAGPTSDPHAGIAEGLTLRDPDGHLVELVSGIGVDTSTYSDRDVKPQDVNHIVLESTNRERMHDFYTNTLGFKTTDQVGNVMGFYRCNANHHSVAIAGPWHGDNRLNHVAFDLTDWEAWARAIYFAGEEGLQRVAGPGRHRTGNNLFSYYTDTEDNVVEYTTEMEQVDLDSPEKHSEFISNDLWQSDIRF